MLEETKEDNVDDRAKNYARLFRCQYCEGSRLHSCTGYDCREAYDKAYKKGQALFDGRSEE